MRAQFLRELAALGLSPAPRSEHPVTEADLAGLPASVVRYLRFMRVLGKPRDWSFRLGLTGGFRRSPKDAWKSCEAWQYNLRLPISRVFHLKIRLAGLLPVLARDTYREGRGRMLVRILDWVTVADGQGDEFDTGELVTYLNDAVLIAPSMLLVPEVRWSPVDEAIFDVSLTERGRTVTARVTTDDRGAPASFSTTDRFASDLEHPGRLLRARWSTPVEGWKEVDGRPLWSRGRAIWHFEKGDFAYIELLPLAETLAFNIPPGE